MAQREVTVRMEGLLGQVLQSSKLLEEAFQGPSMTHGQMQQARRACQDLRNAAENLQRILWIDQCDHNWCATCQHPAPDCTCMCKWVKQARTALEGLK